MPPRNPIYRLASLAAVFFVIPAISPLHQPTKSKITQAGTPEPYSNTVEGLRQLLSDLLLTAKNGDQDKLRSVIMDTERPNYETLFTQIFGQEKGKSWAG